MAGVTKYARGEGKVVVRQIEPSVSVYTDQAVFLWAYFLLKCYVICQAWVA